MVGRERMMALTMYHWVEPERAKYQRMWGMEEYHQNSPGLNIAPLVRGYFAPEPGQTLRDYGCGPGLAMDYFALEGLKVEGVDIVALRPDVIEAPLWELPDSLGSTDYAFCADVMEHLPEEAVPFALRGIRDRTLVMGAFTVATIPCSVGKRYGETLHLTVKPVLWWQHRFAETWTTVEVLKTDRPWRYLFLVWP